MSDQLYREYLASLPISYHPEDQDDFKEHEHELFVGYGLEEADEFYQQAQYSEKKDNMMEGQD